MVSSIPGSQSPNVLAGLSTRQTTPSGSSTSFTEQLVAALEGYLEQAADGSRLEIDIQAGKSQDSGVRQFIVTVKNPESAPVQNSSAVASPATGPSATSVTAPVPASTKASAPESTPPQNTLMDENTRANLIRAEIDAYWAAQPEEVRALRRVADFGERANLAEQLASEGYTIDRAIMVWGWDPLKTMLTRKMYGYDWVPSLNQASVSSPGLALPSQTPYDPNNPPPGSIAVNTDFANGLGITDPWA